MTSPPFASPLRYPGGKSGFRSLITEIMARNNMRGCTYVEPFAGGAGAALSLLYAEQVSRIMINDLDPQIAAFWGSVLDHTDDFVRLIRRTKPSLRQWHRQRAIYLNAPDHAPLDVGFATFFLNRCNRSGIIANGGPIGGQEQRGEWGIDARWSADTLEDRVRRIAAYRSRIALFSMDARDFLRDHVRPDERRGERTFVYLDPPYYRKGPQLYLNAATHEDHKRLADYLKQVRRFKWIVSYDDSPEIRKMYAGTRIRRFDLTYTARTRAIGNEILIHLPELAVPAALSSWITGRSAA